MKLIKKCLIAVLILAVAYQAVIIIQARRNSGTAPVISSDVDEIQIPCQYNKKDLLQGLTAYDVEDGYITEKILVGGFSDFTEPGVSSLEYAVYDNDGNIATFDRKVVFSDYTPPRITLSDPFVFRPADNEYNVPSLSLEGSDKLDGDISRHILITSEDLDFYKSGNYIASVSLKNSFGDEVNLELPVHILEPGTGGYTIDLTEPLIYVDNGDDVRPRDYIAAVRNEYTGEIISPGDYRLTINSEVDTSKDGIYEVQFIANSDDGLQRGETWMTVVVGNYGG